MNTKNRKSEFISKKPFNKLGFTLAEMLIVLGVIGIVAQMTIPSIMSNVQESSWKAAAKEAYSKANQAVELMKLDNNGDLSYYQTNNGTFKPAFMKYFKVIKDCGALNCSIAYKTLSGVAANTWYFDDGQFITADGMFYGINNCYSAAVNYDETTPTGCGPYVELTIDVNGIGKGPNTFGKDVYMFDLINDQLMPMGGSNTEFPASTYCNKNVNSIYQGFGCMYNVIQGIPY